MKRFEILLIGALTLFSFGLHEYFKDEKPQPEKHLADWCDADKAPIEFLAGVKADTERSGKWREVRAKHLKTNPFCAYCGSTLNVQVHHIKPFHLNPELELDPNNLITLCENPESDHHLHIGHAGNFKSENPNVVEDCKKHRDEMQAQGKWINQ